MVKVKDKVTLQQPLPLWGAVKGKTSYGPWVVATVLYVALVGATFLAPRDEFSFRPGEFYSWFGIMLGVSAVVGAGWLWFTNHTFSDAQINFFNDAHRGRNKWAATALRSYLNETYGTDITEEQAISLVYSSSATIARQHNGRTEYVRVFLRGLEPVTETLFFGEHTVSEIPDVSLMSPKLVIVEEPQKPKVYEFSQD